MSRFGGGLRDRCGRSGGRPVREGGDRSTQGRVGSEDAEIAMAVDPRRRHQSGEAIEQLQRRQDLRAVPARTLFGALVEQVLGINCVQPVEGERWPGAVAQQALTSGTVSGRDAYRGVDGEAAAMLPLPHRLRVIARQQAAAHEHAQHPPAHLRLHLGDGGGIEAGGGMEDDPARGGVEHAVDDRAVKVQVRIERRAEAVDEGHRAETRRGARTRAARAQASRHGAQEQVQYRALEVGIAFQEVAQALGHCKYPLPQRQVRQDVIGEMCCDLDHAPRVARGANAAPLA